MIAYIILFAISSHEFKDGKIVNNAAISASLTLKKTALSQSARSLFGELKITNNSEKPIVIRFRHDFRYNFTTIIEDKNRKCVYKDDMRLSYVEFKEEESSLAPKQSLSSGIGLVHVGLALRLAPGQYTVRGVYTVDSKEYKTNTVEFTVPEGYK